MQELNHIITSSLLPTALSPNIFAISLGIWIVLSNMSESVEIFQNISLTKSIQSP